MLLKNLDSLMAKRKINKNILAKESGVPYTTIDGFYKKGWDNVKLSTLIKLAEYFGVSLDFLVYGKESAVAEVTVKKVGEICTPRELELLAAYRNDTEKKDLIEKALKGELQPAKAETSPTAPRRRKKDDIVIF